MLFKIKINLNRYCKTRSFNEIKHCNMICANSATYLFKKKQKTLGSKRYRLIDKSVQKSAINPVALLFQVKHRFNILLYYRIAPLEINTRRCFL